ncbi:dna methyltransferase [Qipengyuania citrea LAMA 915]|uniref:Dna methyltransferase n=1 Tax=Qipengyuania citrea LAMA 915 TaxID=1306953 RepID=A0A0L1KE80_9SPHN|nr:dna methyltransferase [Qipengyuania citrea LAMA 915]
MREIIHGSPLPASVGESPTLSNNRSNPAGPRRASRLRSKGMRVARTDEIAIQAKPKHRYVRRGDQDVRSGRCRRAGIRR